MALGEVVLQLPSYDHWFTLETEATLSLKGPLDIGGNGHIAVYCNVAGSTLYASHVIFSGFSEVPLAIHGGSAFLKKCTFEENTAPALSIYLDGRRLVLTDLMVGIYAGGTRWLTSQTLFAFVWSCTGYAMVTDSLFTNNVVTAQANANKGAGIIIDWGELVIMGSNFITNAATTGMAVKLNA